MSKIGSVKVPSDEMIFSVERKNDKLRVVSTAKQDTQWERTLRRRGCGLIVYAEEY